LGALFSYGQLSQHLMSSYAAATALFFGFTGLLFEVSPFMQVFQNY